MDSGLATAISNSTVSEKTEEEKKFTGNNEEDAK